MAKTGPKPQPTKLKELNGNPGRRPLSKSEVKPDQSAPVCPEWLGELGREVWQQVMESMPPGFIVSVDGLLLAQYCDAWEDYHQACEDIKVSGMTYMTEKGYVGQNPAVNIKFKARADIRRLSAHFGLSPSDRVGLEFGGDSDEDDELDKMLKARAGMN